jgi:hypothetical protein
VIIGWDLATKSNGWCAGEGDKPPTAGAFTLVNREIPADLGCEFKGHVLALHRRFPATLWAVEEPIMKPTDDRWTVSRLMGLWFLLHTLAGSLDIECISVDQGVIKSEWGGFAGKLPGETSPQRRRRHKQLAVEMAEKMHIVLPASEAKGRFDAADAAGCWKVALRKSKSPYWQRWDMLVHGHKGALI